MRLEMPACISLAGLSSRSASAGARSWQPRRRCLCLCAPAAHAQRRRPAADPGPFPSRGDGAPSVVPGAAVERKVVSGGGRSGGEALAGERRGCTLCGTAGGGPLGCSRSYSAGRGAGRRSASSGARGQGSGGSGGETGNAAGCDGRRGSSCWRQQWRSRRDDSGPLRTAAAVAPPTTTTLFCCWRGGDATIDLIAPLLHQV